MDGILKYTLDQKPSSFPVTIPAAIHTTTTNTVQTIKVPFFIDRQISKPLYWRQKLFLGTGIITWLVVDLYIVIRNFKLTTV